MLHCFVPGCKSGYPSNPEKKSLFRPPKDATKLALWKKRIPRADKELDSTCRVCELHFEEDMVIKFTEHTIAGKVERIPCLAKLKEDAVPTIFQSK